MPRRNKVDYERIGRLSAQGATLRDAMEAGGFSPLSARRGLDSMSVEGKLIFKSARDRHLMKVLGKFEDLGKQVTAEQQEALVRGALISNVAAGKDQATASLKMLGADKRVNMFQPDSQAGVIIIQTAPIPPFTEENAPSRYLSCGCKDYCQCKRKALP